MSNDTNDKVISIYIFNQEKTLTLDVVGNNYRLYLLDAVKGIIGLEKFSITNSSGAMHGFNVRKNCVRPELKSTLIRKIRGI